MTKQKADTSRLGVSAFRYVEKLFKFMLGKSLLTSYAMILTIFLALFAEFHRARCPHRFLFNSQKSSKNILKIIGT